jgi:hypothetical protein
MPPQGWAGYRPKAGRDAALRLGRMPPQAARDAAPGRAAAAAAVEAGGQGVIAGYWCSVRNILPNNHGPLRFATRSAEHTERGKAASILKLC